MSWIVEDNAQHEGYAAHVARDGRCATRHANLPRHDRRQSGSRGVTVWERKEPERNPGKEVELPGGLQMPPAEHLHSIVDLEDWIREAERRIEDEAEATRILLVPMATALMTGGLLGAIGGLAAGWIGFCSASWWLMSATVVTLAPLAKLSVTAPAGL